MFQITAAKLIKVDTKASNNGMSYLFIEFK